MMLDSLPLVPYDMKVTKGEPMNKFRVVIELDTYSADPQEWITETIVDQLEEDERLVGVKVSRVTQFELDV